MENDRILIIEDNHDILASNRELLELSGYRVLTAETAAEGRKLFTETAPDLIILDILLPDGNGLDLCREIRRDSGVRILFLSALNIRADVIAGLREGGDDYLGKPYLTEELLLRVEALLRRNVPKTPQDKEHTGPLLWNAGSRQVFVNGTDLCLKPMEYALLELLVNHRDRFLSPEEIYRTLWNAEANGDFHPVQNHIYCLRTKLTPYGVSIESRRNAGYRISWDEQ